MAIYDNFPYTNIHELNLAWIIEQVKLGTLLNTSVTSTDADDYMPSANGMALFKTAKIATNYITGLAQEYYVILAVKEGSHGVQFAFCPMGSTGIYYRTKGNTWTNWTQI